jgi:hypothetical protein
MILYMRAQAHVNFSVLMPWHAMHESVRSRCIATVVCTKMLRQGLNAETKTSISTHFDTLGTVKQFASLALHASAFGTSLFSCTSYTWHSSYAELPPSGVPCPENFWYSYKSQLGFPLANVLLIAPPTGPWLKMPRVLQCADASQTGRLCRR